MDFRHDRLRDEAAEIADRIDRRKTCGRRRSGQEAPRQHPEEGLAGKDRRGRDAQRRELERGRRHHRSEEHTSELQSLMRISYAVFCLKKKNNKQTYAHKTTQT